MLLDLEEKTRVLVEDIVERSAIGRGAIFEGVFSLLTAV